MTESERREADRRAESRRLAKVAEDLLDRRIAEEWEKADAIHAGLQASVTELQSNQSRLIDLLLGVKGDPLRGQASSRGLMESVDLLADDVEWLKNEIGNGGLKIRLPVMAWVAIISAIITGVFSVWAALIAVI